MVIERMVPGLADILFSARKPLLLLFAAVTLVLGLSATRLAVDASFTKTIPMHHPYMRTLLDHEAAFGGANMIVIALMQQQGDIFNKPFLDALHGVTDDLFFIDGIKRETVTSLWTPNVRYVEVTEQGFAGGNLIKSGFSGSASEL